MIISMLYLKCLCYLYYSQFICDLFPDDTSEAKRGKPTTAGVKIKVSPNILLT